MEKNNNNIATILIWKKKIYMIVSLYYNYKDFSHVKLFLNTRETIYLLPLYWI